MAQNRTLITNIASLINQEQGVIKKDHGGHIRVCLVYPNTYGIGMSNLGFRIVYFLLNDMIDVVCERTFLPENISDYKRTNTEIFSYESATALSNFDIIAFSVSFENDFPNIVKILDLANIPLYSANRNHHHPLIIMGGACCYLNPEPVADFFDICFVGEAEGMMSNFIEIFKKSNSKDELFNYIKDTKGIYIPSINEKKVEGCFIEDIDKLKFFPQLITPNTEFSNMYLVEAQRGCPWRCRFCAISAIYSDKRKRGLTSIQTEIEKASKYSKRIGIIGPSLTEYPHIMEILGIEGVEFSITSLRANSRAIEIISKINKNSVSIAIESASEKLRMAINKRLKTEDIMETCRQILRSDRSTLKLYFMIGLPMETDDDVMGIVEMVKEIRKTSKKGSIALTVSVFVPKPITPLQWHSMERLNIIKNRLKMIKQGFKAGDNVKVTHDSIKNSYMQGFFARGDRRVSRALERMVNKDDWMQAADEVGINVDEYMYRQFEFDEKLPWDFLYTDEYKAHLIKEYNEYMEKD
ncbi:MAG: radical SAM protein [Nitrospirae bacterium]|nr:radical SAM protein [Nitrospirota bacterium]